MRRSALWVLALAAGSVMFACGGGNSAKLKSSTGDSTDLTVKAAHGFRIPDAGGGVSAVEVVLADDNFDCDFFHKPLTSSDAGAFQLPIGFVLVVFPDQGAQKYAIATPQSLNHVGQSAGGAGVAYVPRSVFLSEFSTAGSVTVGALDGSHTHGDFDAKTLMFTDLLSAAFGDGGTFDSDGNLVLGDGTKREAGELSGSFDVDICP